MKSLFTDLFRLIVLTMLQFVASIFRALTFDRSHTWHGSLSLSPGAFPNIDEFKRNVPALLNVPDANLEIIKWTLYDLLVYPTAGLLAFTFFANQLGAGTSQNAAAGKTIQDTNMQAAGALPKPQAFYIQSIELDFQPGSVSTANTFTTASPNEIAAASSTSVTVAANDVNAVLTRGALQLNIGMKPYLQDAPLLRFPPTRRFELDAALGNSDTTTHDIQGVSKLRAGGMPYVLTPGITLIDNMNFNVQALFQALVATPSGFNGRLGCYLNGWLARAIQ